jgi:hypothetical protein
MIISILACHSLVYGYYKSGHRGYLLPTAPDWSEARSSTRLVVERSGYDLTVVELGSIIL